MLTVDLDRLPKLAGLRVLDLGCGGGRHAFECYRRGAHVTAVDADAAELDRVEAMFAAMRAAGEPAPGGSAGTAKADALSLPFDDACFDVVIAAEVLEHIDDDTTAIAEIVRVCRPGGHVAVTVPRWLPERACWALSRDYHSNPGGHVRIYTATVLVARLTAAGLAAPHARHHAHGLHTPYWWLRCAVGMHRPGHPLPAVWHRLLVWDLTHRPRATRLLEAALNPVIGKSLVVYLRRPGPARRGRRSGDRGPRVAQR